MTLQQPAGGRKSVMSSEEVQNPNENGSNEEVYKGHPHQIFGHLTYSQHGEDMIFANIFHIIGIEKPSYMDIGAYHPINISNTAYFYAKGSRGVNIDANP